MNVKEDVGRKYRVDGVTRAGHLYIIIDAQNLCTELLIAIDHPPFYDFSFFFSLLLLMQIQPDHFLTTKSVLFKN